MPIDPLIENADQWDRNDVLDDYFVETKQQMAERLERQYPPHNNGKAGEVVSLSTGARLDGMPAHEKPAPFPWLDMSRWDDEPVPPRKWAIPDRVPANQAGLFSGEGGTGKSIIELMKDRGTCGRERLARLDARPGTGFLYRRRG